MQQTLIRALIATAAIIIVGEGLKIGMRSVTFTSFGGEDLNLMMAVALGVVVAEVSKSVASKLAK